MTSASRRLLTVGAVVAVGLIAGCYRPSSTTGQDWQTLRARMVEDQLRLRGIVDERVLAAMERVPRHRFVPEAWRSRAYDDTALPIGFEQTISQPFVVAYMTAALKPQPDDRVLEIGTGSGYQAAVLAELVRDVFSIEILEPLAQRSRALLGTLGYRNVHVRQGDGYAGWPEEAPFDKIIVTAAPPDVPQALLDQLAVDGTMVVPVGLGTQTMTILYKTSDGVIVREQFPVKFVPMVR